MSTVPWRRSHLANTSEDAPLRDVETLLLDLTKRVRPEARWVKASILYDFGRRGHWGFYLDSGRGAVTAERPPDPDVVIRTSPEVLADILQARRIGYQAFLAGELEVRGNLSLALELESLFIPPGEVPPSRPVTFHPKVGRVRWSVLAAGPPEGLPVFLFHGLGATKATLLPLIDALSKDYRVLACDLPGFGDSAKPIGTYDAPWFADHVIRLMDALEIKEAAFCGNSMGGRVALEVGLVAPERCRSLVLLSPALAFVRFRQLAPVVRILRPEVGILPVRPSRGMVVNAMRSIMADPSRTPGSWFDAAADEFFRIWSKARGRMAFLAAARNIYLDEPHGDEGFWSRLATLKVPAQFVFGREDPLIPDGFARHVAEALPDARIALLEGCGHVPQIEVPETAARLALGILA